MMFGKQAVVMKPYWILVVILVGRYRLQCTGCDMCASVCGRVRLSIEKWSGMLTPY